MERPWFEFWDSLTVNYANYSELGIHWTNIVADTFLPQRTSLFGLSLALIIFTVFAILWRCWHEVTPETVEPTRSAWILLFSVGVLTGLLPIIHVHTYIAVGLVSIFLFLFRPRWEWLAFWLPANTVCSSVFVTAWAVWHGQRYCAFLAWVVGP